MIVRIRKVICNSGFKAIYLTVGISVLSTGCQSNYFFGLSQALQKTAQTSDSSSSANTTAGSAASSTAPNSANVAYSCPATFVMNGTDSSGFPICVYAGPDGLTPAWNGVWAGDSFSCPATFQLKELHSDFGDSNNATWVACFFKALLPGRRSLDLARINFNARQAPACADSLQMALQSAAQQEQ